MYTNNTLNNKFIAYAHRGASHYCPENTLMSFYMGVQMGANGIETDVQKTKDGILVLFHDDTLERVTGEKGSVSDYTHQELKAFNVKKEALYDKIPTFEDFLEHFAHRDITFAIELKVPNIEKEVSELIYKYGIQEKSVVTSFDFDYIKKFKEIAPSIRTGYLTVEVTNDLLNTLSSLGVEEICPKGNRITSADVEKWHSMGFNVRAWGISDTTVMKKVYDTGADGMTVNFPDLLLDYIFANKGEEKCQ